MTSDPEQIRAEVTRVLSGVPEPDEPGADIEAIAVNLDQDRISYPHALPVHTAAV